jgi:hypothetical protein
MAERMPALFIRHGNPDALLVNLTRSGGQFP